MAVHYITHQYLADCGLPHGPMDVPQKPLASFYTSVKAASAKLEDMGSVTIETCAPEAFRASVKRIFGTNPTTGNIAVVLAQTAVCAKILTLHGRPGSVPHLVSITRSIITLPKDSYMEALWNVITGPCGT